MDKSGAIRRHFFNARKLVAYVCSFITSCFKSSYLFILLQVFKMCYNIRKAKENTMSEAPFVQAWSIFLVASENNTFTLGAEYFIPKTKEELRKDIAAQELESRNKKKGATNATEEVSK